MPRRILMLMLALWMGNLLPALDATMIGTALPTIVGALEGLHLYGWVFAAYLLTFTTSVPVCGKLADLYGRKPVFAAGIGVYMVASALSGMTQSIEQLILCRALVGVGLGAAVPVAMTIMGDAFNLEQRAKIQWVFASAWFLCSVVGPTLGGAITLLFSWRLVFVVSVPLGVIATLLLFANYEERVERRPHSIDVFGAILLAAGVMAMLLALSPGGRGANLSLESGLLLLALSVALLAAFVWNEKRAPEPLLPLPLMLTPVVGISVLGSLLCGVVQFGASSYLPLFAQGAQGGTAAHAGAVLAPLTLGWPLGAGLGGKFLMAIGFRKSVLLGMMFVMVSQAGFLFISRETPLPVMMASMFVLGLGFGFSNVGFMLAVQESVGWNQRGIATASLQFARSIGGSVGVAVMGALVTFSLAPFLVTHDIGGQNVTSALLDPVARASLAPAALADLQLALADGLHLAFVLMAVVAGAAFLCALAFPAHVESRRSEEAVESQSMEQASIR